MSEHIKTAKEIITENYSKPDYPNEKWVSLSWLQSLPPDRTVCVLLDMLNHSKKG